MGYWKDTVRMITALRAWRERLAYARKLKQARRWALEWDLSPGSCMVCPHPWAVHDEASDYGPFGPSIDTGCTVCTCDGRFCPRMVVSQDVIQSVRAAHDAEQQRRREQR